MGLSDARNPVNLFSGNGAYDMLSDGGIAHGNIGFTTDGGPYANCFAPGTAIATPAGEAPIETLGNDLPYSDLTTVTSDHGMILDGLVINAGALVNSTSIALVPPVELPDRVTYVHVKTAAHDVILAHGAAAKTFVDFAGRAALDNVANYLVVCGHARRWSEMARPHITAPRQLAPGDPRATWNR